MVEPVGGQHMINRQSNGGRRLAGLLKGWHLLLVEVVQQLQQLVAEERWGGFRWQRFKDSVQASAEPCVGGALRKIQVAEQISPAVDKFI